MKLFRVTIRGLFGGGVSTRYQTTYVVATDPTTAYDMVREYLEKRRLGTSNDREMEQIELIAEEGDYPKCYIRLMVQAGGAV